MTNKMLINASQPEELRIALVHDKTLYDFDVDYPKLSRRKGKRGNIYKGIVTRAEKSLNACFVNYGAERHGFLPMKEVALEYLAGNNPRSGEMLREGQEVMVQIEKEERGNKGAALTTYTSLAGCYLVLMPNNPRAGGISRRIEGDERSELKENLSQLELPENAGIIVRTAGVGRSLEELQWDLSVLLKQSKAIQEAYDSRKGPFFIHEESDVVIRAIRDHLRQDIDEIIVDQHDVYEKVAAYVKQVRPEYAERLRYYNPDAESAEPLFSLHLVEHQIETAFQRNVALPSGGEIVFDRTEAITAIDINSAKATRGSDIEETALQTNLESATEIARQLRLRDVGGLVVIDFIDMSPIRNQREVENRLREALKDDRARVQIGRISRFGLLEMSRQRMRPSLSESSHIVCPRCDGRGSVRSVESQTLAILRLIEEEILNEREGEGSLEIRVKLPVDIGTYLLNEKRPAIAKLEQMYGTDIIVISNPHQQGGYEIEKTITGREGERRTASYKSIDKPVPEVWERKAEEAKGGEEPAVKNFALSAEKNEPSLLRRFIGGLFASGEEAPSKAAKATEKTEKDEDTSRSGSGGRGRGGRGGQRRGGGGERSGRGGRNARGNRSGGQRGQSRDESRSGSGRDESRTAREDKPREERQQRGRQQEEKQGRRERQDNRGDRQGARDKDERREERQSSRSRDERRQEETQSERSQGGERGEREGGERGEREGRGNRYRNRRGGRGRDNRDNPRESTDTQAAPAQESAEKPQRAPAAAKPTAPAVVATGDDHWKQNLAAKAQRAESKPAAATPAPQEKKPTNDNQDHWKQNLAAKKKKESNE